MIGMIVLTTLSENERREKKISPACPWCDDSPSSPSVSSPFSAPASTSLVTVSPKLCRAGCPPMPKPVNTLPTKRVYTSLNVAPMAMMSHPTTSVLRERKGSDRVAGKTATSKHPPPRQLDDGIVYPCSPERDCTLEQASVVEVSFRDECRFVCRRLF